MALSNFYKQNVQTLSFPNRYIYNNQNFNTSVDKLYSEYIGSYDNSNVFTMCTDNDLNCGRFVPIGEVTYNSANITSELVPQLKNAVFYAVNDEKFKNTRFGYYDNIYGGAHTHPTVAPKFDRQFIMPYIAIIEKDKITDENINTSNISGSFFKTDDVKRVTLSELIRNKDKYMVTDVQLRFIIVSETNDNRWDMAHYAHGFITDNGFTAISTDCITGQPIINLSTTEFPTNIVPLYVSTSYTSGTLHNNFMWYPSDVTEKTDRYINYPFPDKVEIKSTDILDGKHYFRFACNGGELLIKSIKGINNLSNSLSLKMIFTAEWVIKKIASFGLYVAYDTMNHGDIPYGVLTGNPHLALGEMNSDGFTTGVILKPDEISSSDTKQKNWVTGDAQTINPNNYKPVIPDVKPTEPSQFGNYECKSGGVRYYGMTSTQYFAFNQWINGDLDSGYEPMKSIVYFAYQPFKSNTTFMTDMDNVKIGGKSSVQMKPLNKSTSIYYLGSYNVNRIHNNFLDFSPYTDITVYIPLCGEISIPTNIVMGNTIKTYLITDSQTGGCTGYVTVIVNGSEILIGQRTGQFVQNMPLSSQEVGMRKQAETNALMSVGASTVATGLGIATGNPMAVIGGVGGLIASTVNGLIASNTNRTQSTGSISDVINFNMPVQCYIRISSPDTSIPDNYGHTVGYMTNKTKTIAECKGYTVCNNVDVSGLSCTETEKQMIKSALENGCYL